MSSETLHAIKQYSSLLMAMLPLAYLLLFLSCCVVTDFLLQSFNPQNASFSCSDHILRLSALIGQNWSYDKHDIITD